MHDKESVTLLSALLSSARARAREEREDAAACVRLVVVQSEYETVTVWDKTAFRDSNVREGTDAVTLM